MNNNDYKGVKALFITLAANNDNQREYLGSVRVGAGQIGATKFLAKGLSRSRKAVRGDLARVFFTRNKYFIYTVNFEESSGSGPTS